MAVTIVWTLRARQDLRSLLSYIAKDNPTAAKSFRARILQKVDGLEAFPETGRIVPERHGLSPREFHLRILDGFRHLVQQRLLKDADEEY